MAEKGMISTVVETLTDSIKRFGSKFLVGIIGIGTIFYLALNDKITG